jgi:aldose 1-epimerase
LKQVSINNGLIQLTSLNYGAIIQKLVLKDKQGKAINCVAGFDSPEAYLKDTGSFGACVGRFAGRIAGAELIIDNTSYPIYQENGVHLHGGKQGLGRRHWSVKEVHQGENPFITYEYLSPHLEEGYPGNLLVQVTYQLLRNSLKVSHRAKTDKTTVVNLTNHSYFRLDDEETSDHWQLQINSSHRLQTKANLLPTGKLIPVEDSAYDFRTHRALGRFRLDTPYVTDAGKNPKALAWSLVSGIRISVESNQPAIVVYTPEDLAAICFETQNYPDAPNHPSFPSSLLHPGETYLNESTFRFDLLP